MHASLLATRGVCEREIYREGQIERESARERKRERERERERERKSARAREREREDLVKSRQRIEAVPLR